MNHTPLLANLAMYALGAVFFGAVPQPAFASTQDKTPLKEEAKEEDKGLTLKKLFDKDGFFGRAPRSMAISADGKHGAYLWRPHEERRHGSDLYLVDLATDEITRLTSVSVMAEFQSSAKDVGKDRVKKAKKGKDGDSKESEDKKDWGALKSKVKGEPLGDDDKKDRDLRDVVGDKDADDKKGPRYSGISGFKWSPTGSEMMLTSGGDIYRMRLDKDAGDEDRLVRLTKTREVEREVQYLPDGTGYTTLLGGALIRVRFGDHFVEQLDPRLPEGMEMRDYEISPDGQKVAFIASVGSRSPGNRTVDIATYRNRFMKVRTVPRTVSDDPISDTKTGIFVYALPDPECENGNLAKVFEQKATGPRDILRVPDWAPDSSRVTFAVFDQETSQVRVMEALMPKSEDEEGDDKAEGNEPKAEESEDEDEDKDKDKDGEEAKDDEEDGDEPKIEPAKIVHRFLHNGGPTTPRMIVPRYLADSRRIMLLTELTGFRQLHVLDPVYESLEPLTQGHFETYPIGMPKDRSCVFVEATKEDSACLDLYRVDFETREMTRLSGERGRYESAAFSEDGSHLLANFTAFGTPNDLVHLTPGDKGKQKRLTESHPEKAKDILDRSPEFFAYENRGGQTVKGFLMEPESAKKDEKHPLLIYVYGGPLGTRKQVVEGTYSGPVRFARYMTEQHGYVTATIDPRGMSGYGAVFEKANFDQVGKPQVDDLVDGVKYLIEHHNVDPERVAIHGWSFGGFQTQMCLYTEPDVFKCGIAGAGPTEWENYNSWYSTGTIGDSREGQTDLKKFSLLPLAKGLKGKLLLIHGMEDANVLYQDTVRVYAELLDAGKETLVELFVDPTGGHGLGGHVKPLNQYRKYEEFLLRCL